MLLLLLFLFVHSNNSLIINREGFSSYGKKLGESTEKENDSKWFSC